MGRRVASPDAVIIAEATDVYRLSAAARARGREIGSAVHEMIDGIDCKERPQISPRFLDIGGNVLEGTYSVCLGAVRIVSQARMSDLRNIRKRRVIIMILIREKSRIQDWLTWGSWNAVLILNRFGEV